MIACEDKGCAIEELTLEELRAFHPAFEDGIYDYLDYHQILQKGNKKEMIHE